MHVTVQQSNVEINSVNALIVLIFVSTIQYLYVSYNKLLQNIIQYTSLQRTQLHTLHTTIQNYKQQLSTHNTTADFVTFSVIQRKLRAAEKEYNIISEQTRYSTLQCTVLIQTIKYTLLFVILLLLHILNTATVLHVTTDSILTNIPFVKHLTTDINIYIWLYICQYIVSSVIK